MEFLQGHKEGQLQISGHKDLYMYKVQGCKDYKYTKTEACWYKQEGKQGVSNRNQKQDIQRQKADTDRPCSKVRKS